MPEFAFNQGRRRPFWLYHMGMDPACHNEEGGRNSGGGLNRQAIRTPHHCTPTPSHKGIARRPCRARQWGWPQIPAGYLVVFCITIRMLTNPIHGALLPLEVFGTQR